MKATELMIGDIVRYMGTEAFGEMRKGDIVKVVALQGNYICVGYLWARGDMLKPIPLTGEILEKNFAKRLFFDGEFEGYSYVTDGMQIDQLADSVFEWICPGTINGILNLKYVHELQHALRLCGIEKEIVL